MINRLVSLYRDTHWNLGIKTALERPFIQGKRLINRLINYIDKTCIFPLTEKLQQYLYRKVVYHYGGDYRWDDQKSQNINKSTFNYGYGHIHYALIKSQRPKNILCVGSMYGFIPYMMAKACMENHQGHVYFVDAGYDMADPQDKGRHTWGQGFWKKTKPKQHFSYNLADSYISTAVCTLTEFLKKYPTLRFDYIYHDGDHTYPGSHQAVLSTWKKLNPEGYMALHDIHFEVIAKGITFGQWKNWDEIIAKYSFKMEFTNHYSGLGII